MNKALRNVLIVLQLGGGFLGLTLLLNLVGGINSFLEIAMVLFFSLFYSIGILSSFLIIENKTTGIRFSLFYNLLQVLVFESSVFSYSFISGGYVGLGVSFNDTSSLFRFFLYLGSKSNFDIGQNTPLTIGINISALVIVIILFRILKKKMQEGFERNNLE